MSRNQKMLVAALFCALIVLPLYAANQSMVQTAHRTVASIAPSPPQPAHSASRPNFDLPKTVDTEALQRTVTYIKAAHINEHVDDTTLYYGMIKGAVAALGDPYSYFMSPDEAATSQEDFDGKFAGVGLYLTLRPFPGATVPAVVVTRPLTDSPASAAGIRSGDVITEVDGVSTDDRTIEAVVRQLRGTEGSTVILTVFRDGAFEDRKFSVTRKKFVDVPLTVTYLTKGKARVALVTLTAFNELEDEAFGDMLEAFAAAPPTHIILDLRNNPGGLMDAAGRIVCEFVGDVPIYTTHYRSDHAPDTNVCDDDLAPLGNIPTVVLVNDLTASAAEVLAGALQDHKKATVLGTRTFGKGIGQAVLEYPDHSVLQLTVFSWRTPSGRAIDKVGLEPDVTLAADPDDLARGKDVQLEKALRMLEHGR